MQFHTKLLVLLLAVGAIVLGARMYTSTANGLSPTNIGAFIGGMRSILIASLMVTGGLGSSRSSSSHPGRPNTSGLLTLQPPCPPHCRDNCRCSGVRPEPRRDDGAGCRGGGVPNGGVDGGRGSGSIRIHSQSGDAGCAGLSGESRGVGWCRNPGDSVYTIPVEYTIPNDKKFVHR